MGWIVQVSGAAEPPSGSAVNVVDDTTSVCLMLKGILDPVKEIAKLQDKRVSSLVSDPSIQTKIDMNPSGMRGCMHRKASRA